MAKTMGKYCKAYPLTRLRAYEGWHEKLENVRKETEIVDGEEVEVDRQLGDDDFLYLQENYVVTDGIFKDENIIFDDVTEEWIDYCHNELEFEIPVFEPIEIQAEEAEQVEEPDTETAEA